MKTLELRQIDKQPVAERCYVKSRPYPASSRLISIKVLAAILAGSFWTAGLAFSEDGKMGSKGQMQTPPAGQMKTDEIAKRLAELQTQLQHVQTMLQDHSQHPGGMNNQGQGMQGDKGDVGMEDKSKAMDMNMGGMAQSPANAMQQMPMEKAKMDMMGMANSTAMNQSALPGFPGASHLYHIGSTDFFLDHAEHITLTVEQQKALNQIKQDSVLAKDAAQRKIDQAEQELWQLTAADQPDASAIEAKIREIGKLNGDERLAFIRSVGEAAKVLTAEQRKALLESKAGSAQSTPSPASSPMPTGGMKDM